MSQHRQDAVKARHERWKAVHLRGAPPTNAAGRAGSRSGGVSARVVSGRDRRLHTHRTPRPQSLHNTVRDSVEHHRRWSSRETRSTRPARPPPAAHARPQRTCIIWVEGARQDGDRGAQRARERGAAHCHHRAPRTAPAARLAAPGPRRHRHTHAGRASPYDTATTAAALGDRIIAAPL